MLPFTESAIAGLEEAIGRCPPNEVLQTGGVLETLSRTDTVGDWSDIWPAYDKDASAVLAGALDGHSYRSGQALDGVDVSEDLLSAFYLLKWISDTYEIEDLTPGAFALALVANPEAGAARELEQFGGLTHEELLSLIQSDLLGVELEDFQEYLNNGVLSEFYEIDAPLPRLGIFSRAVGAVFGIVVAWLTIRAGLGPVVAGAGLALGMLFLAGQLLWHSYPHIQVHEVFDLRWSLAQFKNPSRIVLLCFLVLLFVVVAPTPKGLGRLFLPGMGIIALFVSSLIFVAGLYLVPLEGETSRSALSKIWRRLARYGVPIGTFLFGLAVLPVAWLAQQGLLSITSTFYGPPHKTSLQLRAAIGRWIRDTLDRATFGASLTHLYWPLLIAGACACSFYFLSLSSRLVLSLNRRVHKRSVKFNWWSLVLSLSLGLFIVLAAFSYKGGLSHSRSAWLDRQYTVACPGLASEPFPIDLHAGTGHRLVPTTGEQVDVQLDDIGNNFSFGDLTGDDRPEVAIIITCRSPRSAIVTNEIQVFGDRGRTPKFVARLVPPFNFSPFPPIFDGSKKGGVFRIDDKILEASVTAHAPWDCLTCASIHRTISWRWDRDRFVSKGAEYIGSVPQPPLAVCPASSFCLAHIEADLDGDHRPDHIGLYVDRNNNKIARAMLASGVSSRLLLTEKDLSDVTRAPLEAIGVTDADGDGRDEAIVRTGKGGNTFYPVGILRIDGNRLVLVGESRRGQPASFTVSGGLFHGAGFRCGPMGRDGRRRLTVTEIRRIDSSAPIRGSTWAWRARQYKWNGSALMFERAERGSIVLGENADLSDSRLKSYYGIRCRHK
jgi:hypothetical protein